MTFYKIIISLSKLDWKYETKQFLDTVESSVDLLKKQVEELAA